MNTPNHSIPATVLSKALVILITRNQPRTAVGTAGATRFQGAAGTQMERTNPIKLAYDWQFTPVTTCTGTRIATFHGNRDLELGRTYDLFKKFNHGFEYPRCTLSAIQKGVLHFQLFYLFQSRFLDKVIYRDSTDSEEGSLQHLDRSSSRACLRQYRSGLIGQGL